MMEQAQVVQEQPGLFAYLAQLGVISVAVFAAMKGVAMTPKVERMDQKARHRFKFWLTMSLGMGMPLIAQLGGWLSSPVGGWKAYLNAGAFGLVSIFAAMGAHRLTKSKKGKGKIPE